MTEYHFVITATWPERNSAAAIRTEDGVLNVPSGATRQDIYRAAREHLYRQGVPRHANTLFYTAEPNRIGGGR